MGRSDEHYHTPLKCHLRVSYSSQKTPITQLTISREQRGATPHVNRLMSTEIGIFLSVLYLNLNLN